MLSRVSETKKHVLALVCTAGGIISSVPEDEGGAKSVEEIRPPSRSKVQTVGTVVHSWRPSV